MFVIKRWNKEPLNVTDPDVDIHIDYVKNGDLVRYCPAYSRSD